MSNIISIHEFSTGVKVTGTSNHWVVEKFLKGYMNSTLTKIPIGVEWFINQQFFEITQCGEEPTIIGREVKKEQDEWSVIAIVTGGKNIDGNDVCLYRYFLTEGLGKLSHLLRWYYIADKPKFDPFDKQIIGKPHQCQVTNVSNLNINKLLDLLYNPDRPLIIPHSRNLPPIIINELAINRRKISKRSNQLISWVHNANAQELAKIRSFQIIREVNPLYPNPIQTPLPSKIDNHVQNKNSKLIPELGTNPVKNISLNIRDFSLLESIKSNPILWGSIMLSISFGLIGYIAMMLLLTVSTNNNLTEMTHAKAKNQANKQKKPVWSSLRLFFWIYIFIISIITHFFSIELRKVSNLSCLLTQLFNPPAQVSSQHITFL